MPITPSAPACATTGGTAQPTRNPRVTGVFLSSSAKRYTLVPVSGTRTSLSGWLARMGFADVPRAERELASLGIAADDHPLLAALGQAADPDLALTGLAQVADRDKTLLKSLAGDAAFRARLIAVLGVSKALADHLARHPADPAVLRGRDADHRLEPGKIRDELLLAVGADPRDAVPVAAPAG